MSNLNPWRLPQLLWASGIFVSHPVPDLPIRLVTDDSRAVEPQSLFVAIQGTQVDGHRFIGKAVERGARAILLEEEIEVPASVVKIRVPATRPLLGPLAHTFYAAPSRTLKVIGITGTNGKTTVAWLTQHLLEKAQFPCGLIGTVCNRMGEIERPSQNTTPGVIVLQRMLAQMLNEELRACAMEVSSHALDQHRTGGIEWACGVFTNLTSEHLDYHESLENYLKAKLRLFQGLGEKATAVINRDDPVWERVKKATQGRVLTYSLRGDADLVANEIHGSLKGTTCQVKTPQGTFPVGWNLIGRHNLSNLLAALAAVMSLGVPVEQALEGVSSFPGVPGRLERIEEGQPFLVFVDYAHTDGALRRVLTELRATTDKQILVVFGCGGDRDRTKRPRMGRVAASLSDRVIITSDNPRGEDPQVIASEVAAGIKGSSTPWEIILDRREAIRTALEFASSPWLVLIAGKGHETGQILGDRVIPFDERAVVKELLGEKFEHPSGHPEFVEGLTDRGSTGSP